MWSFDPETTRRPLQLLAGLAILALAMGIVIAEGLPAGHDHELPTQRSALPLELGVHEAESGRGIEPCSLCARNELPLGLILDRVVVDSIGRAFAHHNLRAIRKADSLLLAGCFGEPESKSAHRAASTYCKLRIRSGLYLLISLCARFGDVDGFVMGDGPDVMIPLRDRYVNAAVYPVLFMKRVRLGDNAFCLEYDIPQSYDRHLMIGDRSLRVRSRQVTLPERGKTAVLSREFSSTSGKRIELLYESSVCGRISQDLVVDRGDTLKVLTVYDIQGMYAKKAGVHRLSALITWCSSVAGDRIVERPRLGACAYLPRLKLKLPWLLPDIGFHDHRELAFPFPLMPDAWFSQPEVHFPPWFPAQTSGEMLDWGGIGPRPVIVDTLFPDF